MQDPDPPAVPTANTPHAGQRRLVMTIESGQLEAAVVSSQLSAPVAQSTARVVSTIRGAARSCDSVKVVIGHSGSRQRHIRTSLVVDLHIKDVHVGNIEDRIGPGAPERTRTTH